MAVRELTGTADLLRIYIGANLRSGSEPLYKALVEEAREMGLAGSTAYRAELGFGADSLIRQGSALTVSQDAPMVVEVIDDPDEIDRFHEAVADKIEKGLVTRQQVEVVSYSGSGGG